MSHLLDQLRFFNRKQGEFADGHGETRIESRDWENVYRSRWQYDKIVRSTHGVNCTGSCSWKIYVKNGLITWETQQTDYPRTRNDLPNHEPRGCPRGASYSWYIYSANRLKYPKVRKPLLKLWREARRNMTPVDAWASIVEDKAKAESYKSKRGMGGFIRSSWDEVNEIIAAANVYTVKQYGPDRVIGFSPIPAMSMVSYAAGSRYLSLIGGVCLSFYDWYCDLPPASPQIWGEQTDVPESAARCPYTGRSLLHRGPLQGHQDCRHHPGLRRSRQAHRPLAQSEAGHRRRAGPGLRPRHLQGIPPGEAERVLPRLRQALHRPAGAGAPEREGRQLHRRPLPARLRPGRQPRPGE